MIFRLITCAIGCLGSLGYLAMTARQSIKMSREREEGGQE